MCDFELGDEVVCVRMESFPEMKGKTFHIAAIGRGGSRVESIFHGVSRLTSDAVQLMEIGHHEPDPKKWGFCVSRFRKVIRKIESQSLTEWLNQPAGNTDRFDKSKKRTNA